MDSPAHPDIQVPAPAARLSVRGIFKRFGANEVLKNVNFSIMPGEVHALLGENGAGKSTLVKIITGIHAPDAGEIWIDGLAGRFAQPLDAQRQGVALVAQELSLAPALSVLDNMWLGDWRTPLFHRRKALAEQARHALAQVGLGTLSLHTPVWRLGLGERQLIEIARMLLRDAKVMILDEPSATLTDVEIERVFSAVRRMRDAGRSIIYVTHRLGEVFALCDRVSVLRDGVVVRASAVNESDRDGLIADILGRSLSQIYLEFQPQRGEFVLEVNHLSIPDTLHDLSITGERGRVTCIAGQIGSGAIEAVRALAGLVPSATGVVVVKGRPYRLRNPRRATRAQIDFISEDRAGEGIFLRLPVESNLVVTRLSECRSAGLLKRRKLRMLAERLAGTVGIDRARIRMRADELSGGNQQRVAFARTMMRPVPGLLLMNEPTRGVDIGARADIYRVIRHACDAGYAVVMSSSDLEEVMGVADTIITVFRGRKVAEHRRSETTRENILAEISHPPEAVR